MSYVYGSGNIGRIYGKLSDDACMVCKTKLIKYELTGIKEKHINFVPKIMEPLSDHLAFVAED